MLDINTDVATDRRPGLVICAWDVDDSAWDPVEDLSGEPWHPAGARTIAVSPGDPENLASTLSSHLRDEHTRALLLVGRTRLSGGFKLQMRAENRTVTGGERIDEVGPSLARATAPVAEIVRALGELGVSIEPTSEAESDAGSYLLYRVLSTLPEQTDTPVVGLLRAPMEEPDESVRRAVKATAEAMARHLGPLPRRPV